MFRLIGRIAKARAGRIAKSREGVAAVEFALVAPVFLTLIFAIFETAIMYVIATTMEGEVQTAARQIRTGNVQQSEDPVGTFQNLLCRNLELVLDCADVVIDVRTFPDFGSIDLEPLLDDEGNPQNEGFAPGDAGDVVLVRIAYRYDIITPFLDHLLGGARGFVRLGAATAFQTEPYEGPVVD
jgi:hypothetical protein